MIRRGDERAEKRFRSLTRLIAEQLKEAISSGKIKPGEKLSETDLMTSVGVGRVPLREALRSLEAEGYVTFLSKDHVVVSKPTVEEIEDYYTIASVLEGLAARLAVEHARPEEIDRLRELHQHLRQAAKSGDAAAYFDPLSVAEIAEAIDRVLDDPRDLVDRGLERARRFTWEACVREHDAVYRELLSEAAASRSGA